MSGFFARLPQGWQAKAVFILGGVLVVSAWVSMYASGAAAAWDDGVVGVAFMVGSALSIAFDASVPDFVVALMAIWLALSARILGFSNAELANDTAWVIGAAVFVLSLWSAISRANRLNRMKDDMQPVGPTAPPPDNKPPQKRAA